MRPSPEIIIGLFFIIIGLLSWIYKPFYDSDKTINLKKLSVYTGIALSVLGVLFLLLRLFFVLAHPSGRFWFPSAILVIVLGFLIIAFKIRKWSVIKNPDEFNANSRGGYYRRAQVTKRIAVIFVVLLTVFIFISGITMPKIQVKNESFKVNGYFGFQYKLNDITGIDTIQFIPRVMWMNGGSGFFGTYKGNFTLLGLGDGKMFLKKGRPPYIYLRFRNKDFVLFNMKNPEQTRSIFRELKNKTDK